ncbi:MAG: GGDEF domain-containing protein [Ruminiclostridium sp.]|nr:GGDEF domain-containing protein [Ruminiclostridium sp.]
MKKRKTIAVIVGTSDGFFRSKSLKGMIRQAKLLDYDVAIFSLFTITDDRTKHQLGEENLFELLKTSEIAGAVFVDYSFWAEKVKNKIYDMMRSIPGLNVVVYDNESGQGYDCVLSNDRAGFSVAVDHLIEHHGFRKIYCLTGAKEFVVSHMRADGYRDSMKRHGIDYKEDYIFFGDFWTYAATDLAKKLADNEIERPEAVVCGNDKSAVTLVNELIKNGVRVPEDIAVSGYDLGSESITNDPSVTSCTRPDLYTGELCICKLHKLITGEDVTPTDPDTGTFVSGESCGCRRDVAFAHDFNEVDRREQESESTFRYSCMQESLMASDTFDELIFNIYSRIYLIRNAAAFVLCLNKDWNLFREDDNDYLRVGYSDNMIEAMAWTRDSDKRNIPFDVHDLFPPDILLDERPVACYFNAVHFEDRCFGYQVLRFIDEEENVPEDIYHSWASSLSVSLEYIRMQSRMTLMYNRAFANSVRDIMTGLYNRQGYELYAPEVFRTAKERGTKLLVVVADLDDLKKTNDKYGHAEGDNAIMTAARALQTCCGNGEYCARVGGDEFIIFGTYDYDNAIPIFYRSRIDGYLARYNSSSDKPYNIGMSTGFFIDYPDEYDNIDQCFKIADERMYANKLSRKKGRS